MIENMEKPENMEEKNSNQEKELDKPLFPIFTEPKPHDAKYTFKTLLVGVALVSLIFGALGGAVGADLLLRLPQIQKYLPVGAQNQALEQKVTLTEDSAIIDVVNQASPAVVSIVISKDLNKTRTFGFDPFAPFFGFGQQAGSSSPNVQQVGAGSGFFVSSDGLILTNKHVVSDEQASYTVVTNDGKRYDATVLSRDPINDLAIIKIDIKDAPYLKLADSSQLRIGQRVIAIGNSLGEYQNTVTTGIISGIGRSITAGSTDGSEQLSGVIQTDAAINPGNSGGPLLNTAGQVVGINTAIDEQGQLVGFALPAEDAAKALESFNKFGKITRPFLGVRYVMITADMAKNENLPKDSGALILRGRNMTDFAVIPGSPADKAGLVENDIILEVNGKKLDENNTLSNALKNSQVGDQVVLKIYHKGEEKTVNATLGEAK